jgi:hypothetical protein
MTVRPGPSRSRGSSIQGEVGGAEEVVVAK